MPLAAAVRDWISAVGTGGGFLIAAGVYAASLRDRRRKQASLINGWSYRAGRDVALRVVVRNSSDEPAYDVGIEVRSHMNRITTGVTQSIPVLPPHDTWEFPDESEPMLADPDVAVAVSFTDTAGRTWLRSAPGYRLCRDRRDGIAAHLLRLVRLLPVLLVQAAREGRRRLTSR